MTTEQINHRNEMIKEFNEMEKDPIIEIELENGDYEIFYLFTTPYGIQVRNTDILIKWDYCFSLDEHVQTVYAAIVSEYLN
jgi:hypothetical protein